MLKKISIENYALIDSLELVLSPGLNIITGETGAGKSILLGALGLLLGHRSDVSVLKDTSRNCIVEGIFDIGNYDLEGFFEENDLDHDPVSVIRRVVTPAGKSRCYVNDLPVQQTLLRELGSYLIDIHSQHQNLLLSDDRFKISVLDGIAGQRELFSEYSNTYYSLVSAEHELRQLRQQAENAAKEKEWLSFQIEQIEAAGLRDNELEETEAVRDELANASEIAGALLSSSERIANDETGVLAGLRMTLQALERVSRFYTKASGFSERIKCVSIELQDIEQELTSESGRIESDPARLQLVEERLDAINSLLQKHGVHDIAALLSLLEEYRNRLSLMSDDENHASELEARISVLKEKACNMASRLSEGRKQASAMLSGKVEAMLGPLGIPSGKFMVSRTGKKELSATGIDDLDFLFSANPGMEPMPVGKIASGGEISRLMLCIKSVTAKSSELPTIIFDEVDSGVSGRIADAMGDIISELAHSMQVINITHLPQVACKGDTHFYVYKEYSRTHIRLLSQEERVVQIAGMLSGSDTTDAALTQARLLLGV